MVELAPAGEDEGLFRQGFAGDTFNAAWYARRLLPKDWQVAYGTCVGDDAVSRNMLSFMQAEGIDTQSVRRLQGQTVGLYMIHLDDGERSFSYWRGQSAARQLASDPDWLAEQIKGRSVVLFSGITMAILSPEHRQNLCAALSKARDAGTVVAFDTNLRPRLWSGPDEMRMGLIQGATVANVILPSFDEETALFGDPDPRATIDRYRGVGAELVVVKNGADPLTVWEKRSGNQSFESQRVEKVIDSTAAGDSFAAGLLAGLATGMGLAPSVRQATKVSAQVIQARGALADIKIPTGEEP